MSTNNKVFQVLVTKGNKALVAKDAALDAITDGQLGIFDAKTNLAIDHTAAGVKDFYLAVGVDSDGDGVVDAVNFSAGQAIQKENIRDYTYKPHTAARPMVAEITNFTAKPDTDYAIKFEFRNMKVYMRQGYNAFAKTYAVRTACSDGTTGDPVELVTKFLEAFNMDNTGMFKAEAIADGAMLTVSTAPTVASNITVSVGDVNITVAVLATDTAAQAATKIAAAINGAATTDAKAVASSATVQISNVAIGTEVSVNVGTTAAVVDVFAGNAVIDLATIGADVVPGIRITTNPIAINQFCSINTTYYNPRQTVVIPSLVEGFNYNGTVTVTQTAVNEEGNGYDVKQKEYQAGGWNNRPGIYRASTAIGLAMPGFKYFADETKKYDQFQLVYDFFSTAGWKEYLNNLMTVVAIPESDTTTRNAFATVMDAILASATMGFEALADDASAASTTATVVEATPPASAAVDGIA